MNRKFLLPMMMPVFTGCLVFYTNCSPNTFGTGTKTQETNTGNPMESYVALSLGAYTSSSVTGLKVCPQAVTFVSSDGAQPDLHVTLPQAELTAGNSDVVVARFNLPQRTFQRVELTIAEGDDCGRSLEVVNANGTYRAAASTLIKFSGAFTVTQATNGVKLVIQPIVDALATIASNAQVDSSLAATNGQSVAQAPLEFKQVQEISVTDSSGAVSIPAFAAAVASGNAIACAVFFNGGAQTVAGMSDDNGNTYWRSTWSAGAGALTGWTLEVWLTPYPVVGGTGLGVTANFTGAFNGQKTMSCFEYAGVRFPDSIDNVTATTSNSQNADMIGITTVVPNELILAVAAFANPGASAGPGFTGRSSIGNMVAQDRTVSAVGTHGASFVNPPMDWMMNILYFKSSQ